MSGIPSSGLNDADDPAGTNTQGEQVTALGSDNFVVVGIGASAGGLDACRAFLDALPAGSGFAYILVQHLDPTHESMLVPLLGEGAAITVRQATNGMLIEPDNFYIIPPGTYLSVGAGALHLSYPPVRHGTRLPFDFLLFSLAESYGSQAVCVVLSGTGADGTLGLKAVHERSGLIIVQAPAEAGFDGMPNSAIATGVVDLILPVRKIPAAIIDHARRNSPDHLRLKTAGENELEERLSEIIGLLRTKSTHDFRLYKPGTLKRRIERRMAMAGIETSNVDLYLEFLRSDPSELDLLAKDFLINVTSFFRDPKSFNFLAEKIIPDLVRQLTPERPLRLWVPGCSTGEETYSLAMLFCEEIAARQVNAKLQVFASDFDPDAVSIAREGLYPEAIKGEVSPARLERFFVREDHGYRVTSEMRSIVIFTTQNLLADPPFARLDMVSCRNLLIYLQPEAQEKVISLFHFALREGGILLLGNAETAGNVSGRFDIISKEDRIYRRIGHSRLGDFDLPMGGGAGLRISRRSGDAPTSKRQKVLSDLCRRLIMEYYAPAAILINRKHECLYFIGPTDRYLRIAAGLPSNDLFMIVREELRTKLRSAIQRTTQENARVVVPGGHLGTDGPATSFNIDVRPVLNDEEELLLICFVESLASDQKREASAVSDDTVQVAELERELAATRAELHGAILNLEASNEEQKLINEDALSINEEYQLTNEELLTSKEELQSLNEELTALNGQLQETLERQRTTSNDLQNVLYSTNVATIFLDQELRIRFYTPATKSLFNVIPGDIGRPLSDLNSLAADSALMLDARAVVMTATPVEREITAEGGSWYMRRILPYRTQEGDIEGVVITFADITELKQVATALELAKRKAELATIAKSRFLAATSHDLRQPLQTLTLLQGQLAKIVGDPEVQGLIVRQEEALAVMSGMLDTLLDLNQIEAGVIHVEKKVFPIDLLLTRLREEFIYLVKAPLLKLKVIPCGLWVHSDPQLLEQIIRNLLSNALKYTPGGKILLGCRRRGETLRIEVCDSGIGIPKSDLDAIFDEYHQIDNAARDRSRGLGLGLAIVRRLGKLLEHPIHVRSQLGKGSVFTIDVRIASQQTDQKFGRFLPEIYGAPEDQHRTGTIFVIEDDSEVRALLALLLRDEGHHVTAVPDGVKALEMVAHGATKPDIILADYNLPEGLNGLQVAASLREHFLMEIPVIILTGDISTDVLQDISLQSYLRLNKPVKARELRRVIQRLLPKLESVAPAPAKLSKEAGGNEPSSVIYVIDDDPDIRAALRTALGGVGRVVEDYESGEAFLAAYHPERKGCLLIDAGLPGMSGLDLLRRLGDEGHNLPSIMITGNGDIQTAVTAMKAGAVDFIEKPVRYPDLIANIDHALKRSRDTSNRNAWREAATQQIAALTPRQRQIMEMVLAGRPSKIIAADLGISQRSVEAHRAKIMKKTGCKSLPELVRLALSAIPDDSAIVAI